MKIASALENLPERQRDKGEINAATLARHLDNIRSMVAFLNEADTAAGPHSRRTPS